MKEAKPIKEEKKEGISKEETPKEEDKPKPLLEQMKDFSNFKNRVLSGEISKRKLRIPRKAKVRRTWVKKGYIGILKIDENRNITGEKQRVSGSAFRTSDNLYHATNGKELFFWEGKYPIVIQPSWKNNPIQVDESEEKNETYGQPYIKARILQDTIKVKPKKGGSIIIWIIIAAVAFFVINHLTGGKMFG